MRTEQNDRALASMTTMEALFLDDARRFEDKMAAENLPALLNLAARTYNVDPTSGFGVRVRAQKAAGLQAKIPGHPEYRSDEARGRDLRLSKRILWDALVAGVATAWHVSEQSSAELGVMSPLEVGRALLDARPQNDVEQKELKLALDGGFISVEEIGAKKIGDILRHELARRKGQKQRFRYPQNEQVVRAMFRVAGRFMSMDDLCEFMRPPEEEDVEKAA